jgi:histone arginine demethylase JMJD6
VIFCVFHIAVVLVLQVLNTNEVYVQCPVAELNDKGEWSSLGYVDQFNSFSAVSDNVERIHVKDFPPSEFIERYERLYKPVVICGIQDNWKAKHKWTPEVSCSV